MGCLYTLSFPNGKVYVGHRHTEESKAKIASSYRGAGMLGKKHSEETKAKISAARRGL